MILLWKAVVLEVRRMGCKRIPKSFDLKNLCKSPENPGKNGAQSCLTSKSGAQGLHKKKHEDLFRTYTKKRFSWTLWENNCRQKLHKKLFWQVWGNSGKILRIPKIFLFLHLWWKGTSAPFATVLKGQRGNALAMPPFSGVHIILSALFIRCCHCRINNSSKCSNCYGPRAFGDPAALCVKVFHHYRAGVGNLFTTTGRMNCALSLAGRKIH